MEQGTNTGKQTGGGLVQNRPEGEVTKVVQIGNCVGIGNLSGINWEQQQLFDYESGGYAGTERKQD